MSRDEIDHIPSIVPTRDAEPGGRRNASRAGKSAGASRPPARTAGAGWLARLFIATALLVAAGACAWAWQLQQQLMAADARSRGYAQRIGDLEARLSDTDEGMNQNAAVQAVKISELESEVRKLWDNVWKRSKERLEALESSGQKQGKTLSTVESSLADTRQELQAVSSDIEKLRSVAGDMSRLVASAKANQAEVERVADNLNRINLDLAKLDKRVQGNEEWVGSINAFRKQVNTSLGELQNSLRVLQGTP